MRIMAIERDQLATNYYRVRLPLLKALEHGHAEVYFIKESELGEKNAPNLAVMSDVIFFARPSTKAWFEFIKMCRKIGKVVVTDYDDDPFNTSPLNPYYQYVGIEPWNFQWEDGTTEKLWHEEMVSPTGKKIFNIDANIHFRDMFRLNFKKADLVTCTTPELREEFLTINPNVAVLPNFIDPEFYPRGQEFVKSEVRMGWQGGASHYEDLYLVRPAIIDVLRRHKNLKFVYSGDLRFMGLFKDAPQNQMEYHAWVPHVAYPYKIFSLNLDIGLCPLVDNRFNRNKSAIKWLEYSVLSAATVASDMVPYSSVISNGSTGLLAASDTRSWVQAIEELVIDKYRRERLARAARNEVFTNHNINTKSHMWPEAFSRAMKGELVTA